MLNLELQIIIAFLLDLALGDPRWFPHPVRLIGNFAIKLETFSRRWIASPKKAGLFSVVAVIGGTTLTVYLILRAAGHVHHILQTVIAIYFLYSSIALHDLILHSNAVYQALQRDDLAGARAKVALIVGRDTDTLDKEGIVRAAVESVAESMVDGIIAPLFFAVIGGPVGAILYKAVNTLDSTFGYKNDKYIDFGWAAARLDDLANFIPARLTGILIPMAAMLTGLQFRASLTVYFRDRFQHASPNSGHPEAAVAGALGIRLGGPASYFGQLHEKPFIGDRLNPAQPVHIRRTNLLAFVTVILALVLFLGIRLLFIQIFP